MSDLGERYGFVVEVIEDQAADPRRDGEVPVPPGDAVARAEAEHLRHVAEPLHRRWSSTWVRELLAAGRVSDAADVLGRPHRMRGVVVHGDARGRALGYPTANLAPSSAGMVPADGVYAGWLRVTQRADARRHRVHPRDRRRPGGRRRTPRRPGRRTSRPPPRTGRHAGRPASRLPAAISVGTNPTFDGVETRVEAHVLDRDDLELYDREVVRRVRRTDPADAALRVGRGARRDHGRRRRAGAHGAGRRAPGAPTVLGSRREPVSRRRRPPASGGAGNLR